MDRRLSSKIVRSVVKVGSNKNAQSSATQLNAKLRLFPSQQYIRRGKYQ